MSVAQKNGATDVQQQGKPDEEKLQKSVVAARKVVELQDAAADLKERAKKAVDPTERLRLLREAYDKEVEAFGQSKYAKRLQSGAWQGTIAGGGIGSCVALGLGTVVGTLVSGLVSVPTVALGSLVGAGVGTIHGPFLKFGGNDGQRAARSEEENRSAAMKEAERLDQAVEKGASTVPKPPIVEGGEESQRKDSELRDTASPKGAESTPKRKPKKLETRSGNEVKATPEKKKPRKLETRRADEKSENE